MKKRIHHLLSVCCDKKERVKKVESKSTNMSTRVSRNRTVIRKKKKAACRNIQMVA